MAKYPCEFDKLGLSYLEYYAQHEAFHPGVDLNLGAGDADLGNPVVAPIDLEIEYIAPIGQSNGGFGNFIIAYSTAYGVWMRFAHLNTVNVKLHDRVKMGQQIGTVGKTGTTSAHLHWEIFNEMCYDLQGSKYLFYPKGKSKQWVSEHYLDPLKFITDINEGEQWEKECEQRVKELGLLKDVEGFVANMTPHKVMQLTLNLYDLLTKK